jgi:ferredoxin--NADP+ reductase
MTATPTSKTGQTVSLPDARMNLVRPNEPVVGVVRRSEICTGRKASSFVRHVEIDVSGTPLEGSFLAGQSFGVIPPGEDAGGKAHKVRLYSIASPTRGEDGEGRVLSTTVKRTIDEHWEDHTLYLGVASNYLCDLGEGDEVAVTGPNGKRFLLPTDPGAHDYLFIATGTGIAPFRGMLTDLLEAGCRSRVALLMGTPYETDLLYHDFFLRMQEEHENFTYVQALSRQPQADGKPKMYVQQRLSTERDLFLPMLSSERTLIYMCGLAGMEVGIYQQLARLLTGEALEQYLTIEPEALADVSAWTAKTVRRDVRGTDRVFVETY